MTAGIDLRCLTESYGSGVATYTRSMLAALAQDQRVQHTGWSGFTSGWTSQTPTGLPLPFTPRHVRIPNALLNISMAGFGVPRVRDCFGSSVFIWQPNPMFVAESTIPHYVTIHDISFIHYPEFFLPRTRLWYLAWVKRWLQRAPKHAHLIAVSEHTKQDVLEQFPHWKNRITVQSQPPPLSREISSNTTGGNTIVGVGTLEPRKNTPSLVAAFRELQRLHPDLQLLLVGRQTPQWQSYVQLNPLPTGVHVRGYVTEREREEIYSQALCVAYPSFYEGYGLPPLEAMSWGVPVVASHTGAVAEVVGDSAILVSPFRASEEIFAAVHALSTQEEYRSQMKERGLAHLQKLRAAYSLEPLLSLWYDHA